MGPAAETPAAVDGETGSFGTWLRRQREGRGIDLREIAEETKISLVNLRAFEQDRFDILPAAVFARGFLRQYARYVGLDPEEVVNFYVSACRSSDGEEEPVPAPPEPQRGSSWKLGGLALALTVIFALLIWLLTHWNDQPPEASSPPVAASPSLEQAAEAGAAGERLRPPAAGPETGSPSASSAAPAPPSAAGGPSDGPRSDVTADDGARSDGSADAVPLRVTLDFSGACWVEAAVDGERQIAENKIQGESLLLEAAEKVELTIGNIDAVAVEVNGFPFQFDDVPGTKVRTQRIDLETVTALTTAARDGGGA